MLKRWLNFFMISVFFHYICHLYYCILPFLFFKLNVIDIFNTWIEGGNQYKIFFGLNLINKISNLTNQSTVRHSNNYILKLFSLKKNIEWKGSILHEALHPQNKYSSAGYVYKEKTFDNTYDIGCGPELGGGGRPP